MTVYHQVPIHSFFLITVNQQEARLVRAFLFLAFPFCHTSYASQHPLRVLKARLRDFRTSSGDGFP